MKPYAFVKYITDRTNEMCNKKDMKFYLARAKTVISHLEGLGWSDNDIKFSVPSIITSLTQKGTVPTYGYICGILLNTQVSPTFTSTSDSETTNYEQWISEEIKRISK